MPEAVYDLENKANLVLLDDMLARSEAQVLGFSVKGTLGIMTHSHAPAWECIPA
jgi:predicted nucleic acid-binding protein